MVGSSLQRGARVVRRGAWWALGAVVCAILASTLYHDGLRAESETFTAAPAPDPVASVVREVESQGYRCAAEPQHVDRVVFEWLDGTASAIDFDAALDNAGVGAGWPRWYCATAVGVGPTP